MTGTIEATRRLFAVAGNAPDLPRYHEIYPECEAPVIGTDDKDVRRIEVASWA